MCLHRCVHRRSVSDPAASPWPHVAVDAEDELAVSVTQRLDVCQCWRWAAIRQRECPLDSSQAAPLNPSALIATGRGAPGKLSPLAPLLACRHQES